MRRFPARGGIRSRRPESRQRRAAVRRRAAGRQAGFTLIELLVAMSALGLVAVLLGDGLGLGIRALTRVQARTASMADVRGVHGTLRALLDRAQPLLTTGPATGPAGGSVAFAGDAATLRFVAVADGPAGDGALYRFTLRRAGDGEAVDGVAVAGALLLEQCRAEGRGAAVACGTVPETRVLARSVGRLEIAYWGARSPTEEPAWRTAWDKAVDLPALIRITGPADGDLVAAPRIAARRPASR